VVWQRGGGIAIRSGGVTSRVAGGRNPTVSDRTAGRWGVAFDSGGRAYLKVVGRRGGGGSTVVSRGCEDSSGGASVSGGVSAFAPMRGIVAFVTGGDDLCYFNKNTGNADDLAHAQGGGISEVSISARANFLAFTSTASNFRFDGNGGVADVFFKHTARGQGL
jgi:hypothetical protein